MYQWCNLSVKVTVGRQNKQQLLPRVIFPFFEYDRDSNDNKVEKQVLCQMKLLFNKKRFLNVVGQKPYEQEISKFQSPTQLQNFIDSVYDKLYIINKVDRLTQKIRLSQLGFQTVFAYSHYLSKEQCQDELTSKRIDRYVQTWQGDTFLMNMLVTRYNFPTVLFQPNNQDDQFNQIVEEITMTHVLSRQSKSVGEFIDFIKGDLLSEFILGFKLYQEKLAKSIKQVTDSRIKKQINQKKRVISGLKELNMDIPSGLEISACDSDECIELTDAVKRCLQVTFYQKIVGVLHVIGSNQLSSELSTFSMLHMDPKMTWNIMWKRLKVLINDQQILDKKSSMLFHDTIYLSDSEELSFLLLAMYLSNSLLKRFGHSDVFRDFANLVLFGDSGLGKSYAMEAFQILRRVCNVSSITLAQMFSRKGSFGEAQMGSASVITCSEINLKSLFSTEAKEFLDISQPVRKVDIKFKDPVSLSKGVPFIMATNDYPGDLSEVWDKNVYFKNYQGLINYEQGLKDQWTPIMKRLCFVPFVTSPQTEWLKRRNYVEDFSLIIDGMGFLNQKLPYICSLMGAALMLNGRVKDYLVDQDDVRMYAKFMQGFEKTFIGIKLKFMPKKQYERLLYLYQKFCCFDSTQSELFSNTDLYKETFLRDAAEFNNIQESFNRVKQDFLDVYKYTYNKCIKSDRVNNREFHGGYTQRKYQACLLFEYTNAYYNAFRVQSQNQLTVCDAYLKNIICMNNLLPVIPPQVVLNPSLEGKRDYQKLEGVKHSDIEQIQRPVMRYFNAEVTNQNDDKFNENDYDSDDSSKSGQ